MKLRRLEINFPEPTEVTEQDLHRLDRIAAAVCHRYEEGHPERVMWPFMHGFKMLVDPTKLEDDEPIPCDEDTYEISCSERERYPDAKRFLLRHYAHAPEELFQDVAQFHSKFGLDYKGPPRELPFEFDAFRTMFIAEELAEYITTDKEAQNSIIMACQRAFNGSLREHDRPTLEKKFDALIGIVYVALGAAYLHGFPFDPGWARVHEANMRKVLAAKVEDSARNSAHDVVKPEGWVSPDLSDLVRP